MTTGITTGPVAAREPEDAAADGRWQDRVSATDWDAVRADLDTYGCGLTGPLLTPAEAAGIAALYTDDARFRATVNMQRHRFGEGKYRYFAEPFPAPVTALKQALYPKLLPRSPGTGGRCSAARRPGRTAWPVAGDVSRRRAGEEHGDPAEVPGRCSWNALHRDLYGTLVFPLQVVINLNEPGVDHTGGEFLLYEQRPRAQSRATATLIPHGHGLVFTTRDRPVQSRRGWSAAPVKPGVWVIRSGRRFTLGLVFHDAA